jgi:parallel beta-helix repeat protein
MLISVVKKAGALSILCLLILSTVVVSVRPDSRQPESNAQTPVMSHALVLPVTQFGNYGGAVWHEAATSSDLQVAMNAFNVPSQVSAVHPQGTVAIDQYTGGSRGTVYVDDDATPGWYDATHVKTIQEGITNASVYDTVYVYDGVYYENVMVDKALDLVGEDTENVVIDGNGLGTVLQVFASDVTISGFSITGSGTSYGASGIMIYMEDFSVIGCHIYGNLYGIDISYVPNTTLQGNALYDDTYPLMIETWDPSQYYQDIDSTNTVNGKTVYYLVGQSGLVLQDFGYLGLLDCDGITASDATTAGILLLNTTDSSFTNINSNHGINGVYLLTSTNNVFSGCDFSDNRDVGIYADNSMSNQFLDCDAHGSLYGVALVYSPDCIITDCAIYGNADDGLLLSRSADTTVRSTTIEDSFYGLVLVSETEGDYVQDIDLSNTINGRPIYYLVGQENIVIDESYTIGFLGLVACHNVTVRNIEVEGIVLASTTGSSLVNVSSHQNEQGLLVAYASDNEITDCTFSENHFGVYFYQAANNTLHACHVFDNVLPPQISGWQGAGIQITSYSGENTIEGIDCHDNTWGIYFDNSPGNNIVNCSSHDNEEDGIYLGDSPDCILRDNALQHNGFGLGTSGTGMEAYYEDIDATNTMNGRPMCYLVEQSNMQVEDFGYLGLISCTNITAENAAIYGSMIAGTTNSTIQNVTCYDTIKGIFIIGSSDISLIDCDFSRNSQCGIFLSETSNQRIYHCITSNNAWWGIAGFTAPAVCVVDCDIYNQSDSGIYLSGTSNSSFYRDNLYGNAYNGIYLSAAYQDPAYYNQIFNCMLHDNGNAIYLTGGWVSVLEYNTLGGNTIYNNSMGVYCDAGASKNTIYRNNFIHNGQNAVDSYSNAWDFEHKGNYWSDYTGSDADHDGIGDTPYTIPGGAQDHYPLMNPFPRTEITKIRGGLFRLSVTVKNTGITEAHLTWNITFEKGLILLGRQTLGNTTIPIGGEVTLKSKGVFGFGKTDISVTTDDEGVTMSGRVFLFFVLGFYTNP